MLKLSSITTSYGSTIALRGVSLHVNPGEIVALVGANGAGKTTILNTISGITPASKGAVTFENREIRRWGADRIVRLGLCQVPEGRQLFSDMSVRDNLLLGALSLGMKRRRYQREDMDKIHGMFPILHERGNQRAGTLSGGEQQMLAIGRALMGRPRLLLLDEPSMGLAPRVMSEIFSCIRSFRDTGLTVLLVEQNARMALRIADRGYVLETGSIIMDGTAEELMENKEVQRAYLGKGYREVWE